MDDMNHENQSDFESEFDIEKSGSSGFARGILAGVIIGALVTMLGTGLVFLWNRATNITENTAEQSTNEQVLDQKTIDKVSEIMKYVNAKYIDEADTEKIQDSLLHGLVEGLGDRYTVYYTPQEYEDLQMSTTGTYYGIGAGLNQDAETMVVKVIKVYDGTPAQDAGIVEGDIIQYVDGIDSTTVELSNLVQKIRGEEGTTVHLTIYRTSTGETLEKDVERKNVELPSIASEMLDNNIGYIQIGEFQKKTAIQFEAAMEELKSQGMKALIVDVRDNPGGMLASVVDLLDYLLPEGIVVYTEDKNGKRENFESDANCQQYPMVVLVNGNSASASEIFAGAVKDFKYGTLIGTTTFGKGIVQTVFPLSDGDALKVTTAKYYTPSGVNIHGVGIEPDITLEYKYQGPENGTYEKQYDNQLKKAIEVLNEQL